MSLKLCFNTLYIIIKTLTFVLFRFLYDYISFDVLNKSYHYITVFYNTISCISGIFTVIQITIMPSASSFILVYAFLCKSLVTYGI